MICYLSSYIKNISSIKINIIIINIILLNKINFNIDYFVLKYFSILQFNFTKDENLNFTSENDIHPVSFLIDVKGIVICFDDLKMFFLIVATEERSIICVSNEHSSKLHLLLMVTYMVRVDDTSCYGIGDEVFIDNKLKILTGETSITSKIRRMTVCIITSKINDIN